MTLLMENKTDTSSTGELKKLNTRDYNHLHCHSKSYSQTSVETCIFINFPLSEKINSTNYSFWGEISMNFINENKYTLYDFSWNGVCFKLKKPIEFTINEDSGYYVIEDSRLGIDVYDKSRKGLIEFLHEELYELWMNYVNEDDDNLTNGAIKLKNNLKEVFGEVRNVNH